MAGIALLQMNSQSTFLFSRLKTTSTISEVLSLVGHHADIRFNHSTKSLDDILNRPVVLDEIQISGGKVLQDSGTASNR